MPTICPARIDSVATQNSAAMVIRTGWPYRSSRKSPTVRRSWRAAMRRIAGPTQNASTSEPRPAEPTHHQTLSPSR